MENMNKSQVKVDPKKSTKDLASKTKPGKTIPVTFNVTVPEGIANTQETVFLAGSFSTFSPNLPDWDPRGLAMKRLADNRWSITLMGQPQAEIEYKYTLGSWQLVEVDEQGREIRNRHTVLNNSSAEVQTVEDTVLVWQGTTS